MPAMPRINDRNLKIFYKIMGMPKNMQKRSKKDKELDKKIFYEETFRVK